MRRIVDDHNFTIDIPGTVGPNCCRLQVFVGDGVPPIMLATQDDVPATGRSITNAAEDFALAAWRQHLPECSSPPRWIQDYTSEISTWMEVRLMEVRGELTLTKWVPITIDELERTLGVPVDGDRGSRYRRPAPPPELTTRFARVKVHRLPVSHPFRASDCMPDPGRRRARPLWMRVHNQTCCWYHEGDWRAVMSAVARAASDFENRDLSDSECHEFEAHLTRATAHDDWMRSAARSLIMAPLVVNSDGRWVNGQHRAQAARDAGARALLIDVS